MEIILSLLKTITILIVLSGAILFTSSIVDYLNNSIRLSYLITSIFLWSIFIEMIKRFF